MCRLKRPSNVGTTARVGHLQEPNLFFATSDVTSRQYRCHWSWSLCSSGLKIVEKWTKTGGLKTPSCIDRNLPGRTCFSRPNFLRSELPRRVEPALRRSTPRKIIFPLEAWDRPYFPSTKSCECYYLLPSPIARSCWNIGIIGPTTVLCLPDVHICLCRAVHCEGVRPAFKFMSRVCSR